MKTALKRKNRIVLADIGIILFLIFFIAGFTIYLRKSSQSGEIQKIIQSVGGMERKSSLYLEDSKGVVKDWAHFVRGKDWTMEEILAYLSELNSNEQVTIQLLDPSTLKGVSSDGKELNYEDYYNLKCDLELLLESENEEEVIVTSVFTNGANGVQSIGFAGRVPVRGEREQQYLLRVEPLAMVEEHWDTKDLYSGAQISLAASSGAYMLRAPMLKNTNFFEFLRTYNDLTYGEAEDIQQKIIDGGEAGYLVYKNSRGKDTLFAYSAPIDDKWFFIASIEMRDLPAGSVNWSLLIVVIICFLLLAFVNSVYYIRINRQLKEGLEEAAHANEAKTQFLSSMSHDIRTPMNAIIGLTTVASYNIEDRDLVKECLSKIVMSGKLLLTLINDVLDMSKIESGKLSLAPRNISLGEEFGNLVSIVYPQTREKRIFMDVRVQDITREYLIADKLRLNQIWINILSNAVKYTPEGGRIEVSLREEEIPDRPQSICLIYQVKDNGIGMSEEYRKTIFEPFTREKDSRVDKIQGSGLGMAITKQMVDLMEGTIQVQSRTGEGSTFTVVLELPAGKEKEKTEDFSNKKVLVLAEKESGGEMCRALESLGAETKLADSGEKAEELLREKAWDLILADYCPPLFDGLKAVKELKERLKETLPPIVMAAYDWTEIEGEARSLNISGHVQRPVFAGSLERALLALQGSEIRTQREKYSVDLKNIKLLVAEDNDLNWEVLKEMLKILAISADRVENGRECLDRMKEKPAGTYTLIFMDIQMPELNGYETTRLIRQMKDEEKAKIPIIAMTADAFAEDVAACHQAGMNGHIAKPINMNLVMEEIQKYAGEERTRR